MLFLVPVKTASHYLLLIPFNSSNYNQGESLRWHSDRESTCQGRRCRMEWVPTLGWEDPLEEEMASTPVFLPGESHGLGRLAGLAIEHTHRLKKAGPAGLDMPSGCEACPWMLGQDPPPRVLRQRSQTDTPDHGIWWEELVLWSTFSPSSVWASLVEP